MICSASKHRDFSNRVYASYEARTEAMEKADKVLSDLEPEYPAFTKTMLPSHVSGGFWLVDDKSNFNTFIFQTSV